VGTADDDAYRQQLQPGCEDNVVDAEVDRLVVESQPL
jgi:hypothetical protein